MIPARRSPAVHALYGDAAREKGAHSRCEKCARTGDALSWRIRCGWDRWSPTSSRTLSNSRAKGAVGISVAPLPEDAQRVCFTVRDSGIGIPPDKQDAIFEAFHPGRPDHASQLWRDRAGPSPSRGTSSRRWAA